MSIATRPKCTLGALLILVVAGNPLLADDGDGDPTFGDNGLVVVGWNGGVDIARGRAAASLAGGSLLVAGEVSTGVGNGAFGIVKLGPTGLLDIGFGTGGFTRFYFSDDVNRINNLGDIVELPGGSILLAGSTQVDGPVVPEDLIYAPAVAKLTSAGDLDPSFGTGGRKIVPLPWPSENIYFQRPIHQPDGKLLFAGSCSNVRAMKRSTFRPSCASRPRASRTPASPATVGSRPRADRLRTSTRWSWRSTRWDGSWSSERPGPISPWFG